MQSDEDDYQRHILYKDYKQLRDIQPMIKAMENSQICETYFRKEIDPTDKNDVLYNVTLDDCKTKGNGVMTKGFTHFMASTL